jgi:hypothetical protein
MPQTKLVTLDDRELATILAALRLWQGGKELDVHSILTDCGRLDPLTVKEIDNLCAYLNR